MDQEISRVTQMLAEVSGIIGHVAGEKDRRVRKTSVGYAEHGHPPTGRKTDKNTSHGIKVLCEFALLVAIS